MDSTYYNIDGNKVSLEQLMKQRRLFEQYLSKIFLNLPRNKSFQEKSFRSLNSNNNVTLDERIEMIRNRRIETKENVKKKHLIRPKTSLNLERKVLYSNLSNKYEEVFKIEQKSKPEKKPEIKVIESKKRQKFGLKVAVADFSQKIIENQGMYISTFENKENDDENIEVQQSKGCGILSELYSMTYVMKIFNPLEKFKRAIKTIALLLKATTSNEKQSEKYEKGYLTFAEFNTEIEENSKLTLFAQLNFNVSYYKAKKETQFGLEAINIMKKHFTLRTEENIHSVVMALNNTVEAFREFPKAMQIAIVKHGWYEKFGPKRVIIRQHHAAQNFYFIISGKTMVVVARKNNSSGMSYGETVAFLKKGNSFGELALMYGGKRSASVICCDDVELLSVSREDFIEIFMNLSTDIEPMHIQFLRNVSILKGWPIHCLPYDDPKICLFTYFRKGTVLCRDSNNNEWIYIVFNGKCRVIKAVNETAPDRYRVNRNSGEIIRRYHKCHKEEKNSKVVYLQLNVLLSGDVFGLESVALNQFENTMSMTLISDGAECVAIERRFFTNHINGFYMKHLRHEIQPYPLEEELKAKFKDYVEWKSFHKSFQCDH